MVTGTFTDDKGVFVIENKSYAVIVSSLELKSDQSGYKKVLNKGTYSYCDDSQLLDYLTALKKGLIKPFLKSIMLILNFNSFQK
jgi:hypothetical protein